MVWRTGWPDSPFVQRGQIVVTRGRRSVLRRPPEVPPLRHAVPCRRIRAPTARRLHPLDNGRGIGHGSFPRRHAVEV